MAPKRTDRTELIATIAKDILVAAMADGRTPPAKVALVPRAIELGDGFKVLFSKVGDVIREADENA